MKHSPQVAKERTAQCWALTSEAQQPGQKWQDVFKPFPYNSVKGKSKKTGLKIKNLNTKIEYFSGFVPSFVCEVYPMKNSSCALMELPTLFKGSPKSFLICAGSFGRE